MLKIVKRNSKTCYRWRLFHDLIDDKSESPVFAVTESLPIIYLSEKKLAVKVNENGGYLSGW